MIDLSQLAGQLQLLQDLFELEKLIDAEIEAGEIARAAGFTSLTKLAEGVGTSRQVLHSYQKRKPQLFKCFVLGAAYNKLQE